MKLKNNIPDLIPDDISLARIARMIDSANQTVQRYAGGKSATYFDGNSSVSIGTLIKIAEAIDVHFSDLFEEVE